MRSLSWDENSDQIDRIRSRNGHVTLEFLISGLAQTIQHFRERELLSTKARDEAAAANQTPIFEATKHAQQNSPAWNI